MKQGKWAKKDIEYLIENYARTSNRELARQLKKSRLAIADKAHQLKLLKDDGFKEPPFGKKSEITYREETECMADIICFMHRRGEDTLATAKMIRCPVEQVEEILERCMNDGMYDVYKRRENRALFRRPAITTGLLGNGHLIRHLTVTPSPQGEG